MANAKHTPRSLEASRGFLWGDTPFHSHVRMAEIIEHSPMNGMDAHHLTSEIAKRYNSQPELLEALEQIVWKLSHNGGETAEDSKPVSITRLDITIKDAVAAIAKARGE